MRTVILNKWVRDHRGTATALVGIPAASINRIEQADQFALDEAQRSVCRSVVVVKGWGLLYVSETVEQIVNLLNGK